MDSLSEPPKPAMFWNFCPSLMTMSALPIAPGATKLIALAGAREVNSLVLSQVVCHCVRMDRKLKNGFYYKINVQYPRSAGKPQAERRLKESRSKKTAYLTKKPRQEDDDPQPKYHPSLYTHSVRQVSEDSLGRMLISTLA